MGIIAGSRMLRMARQHWWEFRDCPSPHTFCQTSFWGVPLGTQSAASPCSGNRRILLAILISVPGALSAQLTTGTLEGTLYGTSGNPVPGSAILITGGAGFRTVVHSNSNGEFSFTLSYGRYQLSGDSPRGPFASG